jgi:hypothetical protein
MRARLAFCNTIVARPELERWGRTGVYSTRPSITKNRKDIYVVTAVVVTDSAGLARKMLRRRKEGVLMNMLG